MIWIAAPVVSVVVAADVVYHFEYFVAIEYFSLVAGVMLALLVVAVVNFVVAELQMFEIVVVVVVVVEKLV